jgi:stage II sporulation protein AB (anti-sigma F factor)
MAPTHSTDSLGDAGVAVPSPSGPLDDDSRLRVAVRPQPADTARVSGLRLQLSASTADVPFARAAITRLCEHLGIDDEPTENIRLAVTEACSNCALHAYDDLAVSPTYTLDARVDRRDLRIVVSDRGMGLHGSHTSKARSGGYGLDIIRQLAGSSHVSERPGGGTRVVMRFALAA